MRRLVFLLLVVISFAEPRPGVAQPASVPVEFGDLYRYLYDKDEGDRLRFVLQDSTMLHGGVYVLRGTRLVVASPEGVRTETTLDQVDSVWNLRRGSRQDSALKGFMIGGTIGAALGVLLGAASMGETLGSEPIGAEAMLVGGVFLGFGFGIVGMTVGALAGIAPHEWHQEYSAASREWRQQYPEQGR